MLVMCRAPLPVLERDTLCAALELPSGTLGNARFEGLTTAPAVVYPVPVSCPV